MRAKSAIGIGIQPSTRADLIVVAGGPASCGLLEMMLTELAHFFEKGTEIKLEK